MSHIEQHRKSNAERKSARDLRNLIYGIYSFTPGNSAEGLGSRRKCCWGYISIFENTPKKLPHLSPKSCCKLVVQGRVQLEHSSHTVKAGVKAIC